jgi:glucokinase
MLVAGDIGGTKTDLAVYANRSGLKSPIARKQFHSTDYGSLQRRAALFQRTFFACAGDRMAAHADNKRDTVSVKCRKNKQPRSRHPKPASDVAVE